MPEIDTYAIKWDQTGEKLWETGVDHGVLYKLDENNAYSNGYAWNGLTSVNLNPTGGETNTEYADNIEYAHITSREKCGGTIEAYQSPKEFDECDGSASLVTGVSVGQQRRKTFGFSWRSRIGNDVNDENHGYKIHIIYGAKANPSSKQYSTINESPELTQLSWDFTATPVEVEGLNPTAYVVIDSTVVPAAKLQAIKTVLYGTPAQGQTPAVAARLPLPDEIATIMA